MSIVPAQRLEIEPTTTPDMHLEWFQFTMGGWKVTVDTVGVARGEFEESTYELHIKVKRGDRVFVEHIDASLLAIMWARLVLGRQKETPRRQVWGIKKQRASCRCGGDYAWMAQTSIDGLVGGEIMLGCVCHTEVSELVASLDVNVFGRDGK